MRVEAASRSGQPSGMHTPARARRGAGVAVAGQGKGAASAQGRWLNVGCGACIQRVVAGSASTWTRGRGSYANFTPLSRVLQDGPPCWRQRHRAARWERPLLRGGWTMIRRCGRCALPLLPADGPSLLLSRHGARAGRVAVHLRCWLAWQRPP